jgi:hypothetical protein
MGATNQMFDLFQRAETLFSATLSDPKADANNVAAMAQIIIRLNDMTQLEPVLEKLTVLKPGQAEPRYDLALLKAVLGKTSESVQDLKLALDLNARELATNPAAPNLLVEVRADPHFDALRNLPEFQKIVPPK